MSKRADIKRRPVKYPLKVRKTSNWLMLDSLIVQIGGDIAREEQNTASGDTMSGYETSDSNSDAPKSRRKSRRKTSLHDTGGDGTDNNMYVNSDHVDNVKNVNNSVDNVNTVNMEDNAKNANIISSNNEDESEETDESGSASSHSSRTSSGTESNSEDYTDEGEHPEHMNNLTNNSDNDRSVSDALGVAMTKEDLMSEQHELGADGSKIHHNGVDACPDPVSKNQLLLPPLATDPNNRDSNDPGKDKKMYYSDSSIPDPFPSDAVREPETAYPTD
jgi:hypothetical protein